MYTNWRLGRSVGGPAAIPKHAKHGLQRRSKQGLDRFTAFLLTGTSISTPSSHFPLLLTQVHQVLGLSGHCAAPSGRWGCQQIVKELPATHGSRPSYERRAPASLRRGQARQAYSDPHRVAH